MKNRTPFWLVLLVGICLGSTPLLAKDKDSHKTQSDIGVVNFRLCIENSQMGLNQQNKLENMRNEMVASLEKIESEISDIAAKLRDSEYVDSISPDMEDEMKMRYRMLSEQLSKAQTQFYQAYQQAHIKVIQSMNVAVAKAAETVADKQSFSFIMNEEVCFYFKNASDITTSVIKELDTNYEIELQANALIGEL